MERNPIKNDARKARRHRSLGYSGPCLFCGRETPENFRSLGYTVIEKHHVLGKINDAEFMVPLCRGCHDKQTELMRDHGIDLRHMKVRHQVEILADNLAALGLFHQELGSRLLARAEQLQTLVQYLDSNIEDWRAKFP